MRRPDPKLRVDWKRTLLLHARGWHEHEPGLGLTRKTTPQPILSYCGSDELVTPNSRPCKQGSSWEHSPILILIQYAMSETATHWAAPPPASSPPPLAQIWPYISVAASSLVDVFVSLVNGLDYVLRKSLPSRIIFNIFAPVIVFVRAFVDLFVLTPYTLLNLLLELVHPIYVFVGVACITGLLVAYLAKFVAEIAVKSVENKFRAQSIPKSK